MIQQHLLEEEVDDPQQVRISQRIMDQAMIPFFQRGNPGQAVFAGARACARSGMQVTPRPDTTQIPVDRTRQQRKYVDGLMTMTISQAEKGSPLNPISPIMIVQRLRPPTGLSKDIMALPW